MRAALIAFALLAPAAASAQSADRTAATIDGILDVEVRDDRRLLPGPTRRALVRRSDSNDWLESRQNLPLFWDDRVFVEARTVVRLGLRAGDARGQVSLSPELQTPTGELIVNEIGGKGHALYEIKETPRELGDLQLVVARGSLALDWARGRLVLLAGGIRSVVTGTRIVVAVDSATQRGFLHLIEGSVSFPDRPDINLRGGEWVVFQGANIITVGVPTAVAPERLVEAERYTARQAWPKPPFYKRAWPYLTIGALAAIYYGLSHEGYDPEQCSPRQCPGASSPTR
jgi:hypothetical protein